MLGLYFGGQWFQTAFGNQYGNIELDAMLDESHEWAAEATTSPVELGAPVTDHVIEQSDKLRIKGFVTDAPLTASPSVTSRSQGVFDLLYRLIKLREPVTVYTLYKIYDNMVLTSVTIPRTAGTGEAIEFRAEFVRIRKVASRIVDAPAGVSAKKDKKSSKKLGVKTEAQKDTGKKQTQPITKPSSTLARMLK